MADIVILKARVTHRLSDGGAWADLEGRPIGAGPSESVRDSHETSTNLSP
jgi:hypothetical protein